MSVLPDLRDVNATLLTERAFETLENCAIATIDMGLQLRWFPGLFFASCSALLIKSSFNSWITRLLPAAVSTTTENIVRGIPSAHRMLFPSLLSCFILQLTKRSTAKVDLYLRDPPPLVVFDV